MPVTPYERDRVERIDDPASAYRYCSGEELRTFLDPGPDWTVADLGSGTGRFTSELAPVVDRAFAVDLRSGMQAAYREKGVPTNVTPLVADFERLPLPTDSVDGAISMRTYHHEFETALPEVGRVLRPGGRLVIVDWSATGAGERETPVDEEYLDLATVQSHLLEAGFRIAHAEERRETFVIVGVRRHGSMPSS